MATQQYSLPNISVQFAFQDLSTGTTPQPYSPRQITITNSVALTTSSTASITVNTLGNITPSTSAYKISGSLPIVHGGTNYTLNWTYANANTLYGCFLTSGSFTTVANTDHLVTWNWYEANTFTRDFQTKMGRQHELDRTEASTLTLKLDNRDGRWYPWNTNTFSYTSVTTGATNSFTPSSILTVGIPVRILATWQGTQYPVFFGYVDSWQPSAPDEMNTDTTVQATDILKLLSQTRLSNSTLYQAQALAPVITATNNNPTPDLWRCNDNSSIVTGLLLQNTGPAAQITSVGVTLSTTSIATVVASSGYITGTTIYNLSTSGGSFTLSHQGRKIVVNYGSYTGSAGVFTFSNCYLSQGSSFNLSLGDYIVGGISSAAVNGTATLQQQGVQVYDPNAGGISLGSTGSPNTFNGYISINNVTGAYPTATSATANTALTIEGWFKGASIGDVLLTIYDPFTGGTQGYNYQVYVNATGQATLVAQTLTTTFTNTYSPSYQNINVTDGNWHLITMSLGAATSGGAPWALYVDGALISIGAYQLPNKVQAGTVMWGGGLAASSTFSAPVYQAYTTATVSDISFGWDQWVYPTSQPVYASKSLNRYRVGQHFSTSQTVTTVSSNPTITPTSNSTLNVQSTNGFLSTGGIASFVHIVNGTSTVVYPFTYSGVGTSSGLPALLGVNLIQGTTSYTPTIGESIVTNFGVATNYRLLEIAEVAGLVPDDGTSSVTTAPLNYTEGVVKQLTNEQSTTYASTALDYSFQFEDTENGFFYQDQSGTLQFLPRFYPQTHAQNSAQWSDSGTALNQPHYQLNVEVFMDDLDTWEVAQLTTPGGGTTYVVDPTGTYVNQYAPRTFSRGQIWASRQQDVNALGYMIVNRYRQPITRPQKVIIDNTYVDSAGNQPNQLAMLGTNLWDQIVFNHDGYGTNYAQAVVVESIAHDFKAEPGQWQSTFVLSPYEMNGSSTVNAGSFFRISTSSAAADYSKFQWAQTSVAYASTISSTASSVQVTPQTAPSGLPYGIALPASASSGTTINHAGTNYAIVYTGKAQTSTTTTSAVSLTTSSSVTLTLGSVTNFPTGGGLFYVTNGGVTYQCTYASVSGSTITGCKLGAQYSGVTVTTASGNAVYGPQLLTGVTCASSVSLTAGDTAYYTSGTAQDTFGG